eukprot:scaffold2102_cov145-Skeletonema_menzelii.AAC.1
MSQEESKSYGAIPRGDAEDTAEFDEKNLSYLKESGFSWNRFCRAVLPIIIALLIMGGFAFGMGHGQRKKKELVAAAESSRIVQLSPEQRN